MEFELTGGDIRLGSTPFVVIYRRTHCATVGPLVAYDS